LIRHSALGIAIVTGTLVGTSTFSPATTWPERTVRVIVSNPAGVSMDIIARLFAERLAKRWGQPVVVENLPGTDGIVAAREFVSRRDDHTLLYSFPSLVTTNPLVHEKLPYDPDRDLVAIATTSENSLAIAAAATLNIRTLAELAEFARANPGQLTWAATPGLPYYALAAFQKATGGEMVQATYRDFNQAFIDVAEGRIGAVAAGLAPLLVQAHAGKIRLLALVNRYRVSAAPDLPTASEAGYPDLTFNAVTGFFGWRDMPTGLRHQIAADVREIASDPIVGERLEKIGVTARGSTPTEFDGFIEQQRTQISEIVRSLKPR
jgi:tripartite-type tricarboxylate transporter receptor subunit TctC